MDDAETPDVLPMWPVGASPEYVTARLDLARAERALRDRIEDIAAARRAMPDGTLLPDYLLAEGPHPGLAGPDRRVRLVDLFGDHDTLAVYHLMYHPDADHACPMCSMWVDGLYGVRHHIQQHAAFAVVAKAPLPKLRAWALGRGWYGLRILSSYGSAFNSDMHAEHPDGQQRPMLSVFVRDGARARHFYTVPANFLDNTERGIDLLCPVWSILDLLPKGRGDWYAENQYDRGAAATDG